MKTTRSMDARAVIDESRQDLAGQRRDSIRSLVSIPKPREARRVTVPNDAPRVAILTVTTEAASHLPAYLEALADISYSNWHLWVVDNASRDGSAKLVETAFPQARVLRNDTNLGFTGACNRVLRQILSADPSDFVLFLNDDTRVTPGFLEPLIALADDRTLVAPMTCLEGTDGLLDDAAGAFDWWRGTWKRRVLGARPAPTDLTTHAIETANLSCLLIPVQLFRDVGLLDEAFFVYYDDTDLCRRARDAGYRIFYEPGSLIWHHKGATLGGQLSAFGCYYLARNRPYLLRKHLGNRLRFWASMAYYLPSRAARVVLWTATGRRDLAHATVAGLWDFARGRMGRKAGMQESRNAGKLGRSQE